MWYDQLDDAEDDAFRRSIRVDTDAEESGEDARPPAMDGLCVYARDIPRTQASKEYGVRTVRWWPDGDQHAYELLRSVDPRRAHFDLEWPRDSLDGAELRGRPLDVLSRFERAAEEALRAADERVHRVEWARATSSAPKAGEGWYRESWHLVARCWAADGRTEGVFGGVLDWKAWSAAFFEGLADSELGRAIGYRNTKGHHKSAYDEGIVKVRQCWRMVGQSKWGTDRPLRAVEPPAAQDEAHRVVVARASRALFYLRATRPSPEQCAGGEQLAGLVEAAERIQRHLLWTERRRLAEVWGHGEERQHRLLAFVDARDQWAVWARDGQACVQALCADDPPQHLRRLVEQHRPRAVHAQWWTSESRKKGSPPERGGPALRRELVFDVDLRDLGVRGRRLCACAQAARCCDGCWLMAEAGACLLGRVLGRTLGWRDLRFFFSGSKGWHCWVMDGPPQLAEDDRLRGWVMGQLQALRSDQLRARRPDVWREAYTAVVRPWYGRLLLAGCVPPSQGPDFEMDALWPLLDAGPTPVKHAIKVPFGPHPATGRCATPFLLPRVPGGSGVRF